MKRSIGRIASALIAFAVTAAPAMVFAADTCCAPTANDWPFTSGSLGNSGYTHARAGEALPARGANLPMPRTGYWDIADFLQGGDVVG